MTVQSNIDYHFNRSYEVSVWTLQDSFITVLKWSEIEHKETILNPQMTINTDGTLNFSFSIPMSLYVDGIWCENPIWYNTSNGTLITNMRKIKVIFNKGNKEDEEVFEFLITTINMTHLGDIPMCDITCDGGMAYHELGKLGYKISLSSEAFYEEDAAMFSDTTPDELGHLDLDVAIDSTRRLHPTIDYWCQKMDLTYAAQDSDITDPRKWYYRVEMDWSSYSNTSERRLSSKIYEEEYVASWDENCNAERVEAYTEKERLIDEENSNFYNLTLNLAKTFGVYCRYKYLYDDNYHIIGKLIIFYNNFFNEREGTLLLSYPNTTTNVTRNIDSTDIVTKMYVDSIEDDSDYGMLTIMDADVNKMREDYLLNFDYLHDVKTITEDLYNAISEYEKDIRQINNIIIRDLKKLTALSPKLTEVAAKKTVADNGIILATERIGALSDKIKALDNTDGIYDGVISLTVNTPDKLIVVSGKVTIKKTGVILDSIHVYPTIPIDVNDEIKSIKKTKLKDGTIELSNIEMPVGSVSPLVFVIYDYDPAEEFRDEIEVWENKLAQDEKNKEIYTNELNAIENEIEQLTNALQENLDRKKYIIDEFALMMGPALREGHWTPEDYTNYGDRYVKSILLPVYRGTPFTLNPTATVNHLSALWDEELFDDELKNYYELGVDLEKTYYPHIKLNANEWKKILNKLKNEKKVSIVYYDYAVLEAAQGGSNLTYQENEFNKDYHWHIITIGSGAEIIFINNTDSHKVEPAIIIIDAETMPDDELEHVKTYGLLAIVTTTENNDGGVSTDMEVLVSLNNHWYDDNNLKNYPLVYPRLCIDTLDLMNNSTDFGVKYNSQNLRNYYDYSILIRDTSNLITFSAMTILLKGMDSIDDSILEILKRNIEIKYTISNASTSIYLDAISVLSENSHPKVSYTVSPSILNKDMIKRLYKYLNRIININDIELKLHDAYGYISELSLNLDKPWEDSITVLNYNNKFEDLFSTITAQTEEMQRREYALNQVMQVVLTNGTLDEEVVLNTLASNGIIYDFNNHKLTITETDGILGSSDLGVITYRNNGIFTAETKDENGEWVWKSAIVSTGINADSITTGLLDTSKIFIYSGDDVRFLWNEHGIYAYRSITETALSNNWTQEQINATMIDRTNDVNPLLYAVFNSEGLHLINNSWTVKDDLNNDIPVGAIKLVEVSWNGFIMRNRDNEKIFYADSLTGNLTISGAFKSGLANIFYKYDVNGDVIDESPPILPFFVNDNGDMYIGPTRYNFDENTIYWNCLISHEGILTAKGATIYGDIYADNGIFNGTITSYDGNIGGWIIDADKLYHSFQVNDSNNLSPGSLGYVETLLYVGVGTGNYAFWAGSTVENINDITLAKFSVSKSGILTATGANITGEINATTGHVGGWTIGSDYIGNAGTKAESSIGIAQNNSSYFLWAGNSTPSSAGFNVTTGGKLSATGADISGKLTSTEGRIGKWYIGDPYLGNADGINDSTVGMRSATSGKVFWAGGKFNGTGDNEPKFYVTAGGALTAKNATLEGSLTAGGTTTINSNKYNMFLVTSSGIIRIGPYDDNGVKYHLSTSNDDNGICKGIIIRGKHSFKNRENKNVTARLFIRTFTTTDNDNDKQAIRLTAQPEGGSLANVFCVGYEGDVLTTNLKVMANMQFNTYLCWYVIGVNVTNNTITLGRVGDNGNLEQVELNLGSNYVSAARTLSVASNLIYYVAQA